MTLAMTPESDLEGFCQEAAERAQIEDDARQRVWDANRANLGDGRAKEILEKARSLIQERILEQLKANGYKGTLDDAQSHAFLAVDRLALVYRDGKISTLDPENPENVQSFYSVRE